MGVAELSKMTFWVGGIGLLWNLVGVAAFYGQVTMNTSDLPDAQRVFYETTPVWAKAAFFVAVSMGVVGCLALLTGQNWARYVFALSLVGILLQNLHAFVLGNGLEVFGASAIAMPATVLIVAVFLLYYANSIVQ